MLDVIRGGFTQAPSRFDDWTPEGLALHLAQQGLDIPEDVAPFDLLQFAEELYVGREAPSPPDDGAVQYTDASGTEYFARPHEFSRLRADSLANGDRPRSVAYDGYMGPISPTNAQMRSVPSYTNLMNEATVRPAAGGDEENNPIPEGDVDEQLDILRQIYQSLNPESSDRDIEERIRLEFQPPSKEVVELYKDLNHPRKGPKKLPWPLWSTRTGRHCHSKGLWRLSDPFCEGSNSDLARYGVGISLYFKWLKWLSWTFIILSLVTLPQVMINASGTGSGDPFTMDSSTLGHLVDTYIDVNLTDINATALVDLGSVAADAADVARFYSGDPIVLPVVTCWEDDPIRGQCIVDRGTVARIYSFIDIIAMSIFLLAVYWLRYFEEVESQQVARRHLSVEEYTIHCVKIPPQSTEMSLKKFFGNLTGEPVADVHVAQNNGALIELYVERGKVLNQLWRAAARVHLLRREKRLTPGGKKIKSEKGLTRKITSAVKTYDRIYAKFLQINEQRHELVAGTEALSAYVTFETQAGYLKCLDLYPNNYWARKRQPVALRMDGMKLKIRTAPPPSTVQWENMHYKWSARRTRRWVTAFATAVVLFFSVGATFFAERAREDLSADLFSQKCELDDSSFAAIQLSYGSFNGTTLNAFFDLVDEGDDNAEFVLSENEALEECYCSGLSYSAAAQATLDSGNVCHSYWFGKADKYIYTFLATLVISFVNIFIEYVVFGFARYEKHHSVVNMELSMTRRVFVALVFNTGIVLLLVNARLDFFRDTSVGSGSYNDFVPDWYPNVGTQLLLTMILNIFAPHSLPLFLFARIKYRRWRYPGTFYPFFSFSPVTDSFGFRVSAISQQEMNAHALGPIFHLALRTAQSLMTVYVTLLYSAGLPLLYPIAAAAFTAYYWVDKFLFLRFYRTPPAYSNKLSQWSSSILSYAVILHLMVAIWMYSADGIFRASNLGSSPSSVVKAVGETFGFLFFDDRLFADHILPLFIFWLVLVLWKLVDMLSKRVRKIRDLCCSRVTCGGLNNGRAKRRYLNPSFFEAMDNGDLRGIKSYNLLENPVYQRAFTIDPSFAESHRHVGSVQNLPDLQIPKLPESLLDLTSTKSNKSVRNKRKKKKKTRK